jgi:adenylate cyclase
MQSFEKQQFDRFVALLDGHHQDPTYSVADWCYQLGVSRSQLSKIIKDQSGLSLSLYIRQFRLKKARDLLASTDLRIVEIGDAVGIDSPQTFTKYFTQEYGLSPTEYRKMARAEKQTEPASATSEAPPVPEPEKPEAQVPADLRVKFRLRVRRVVVAGGGLVLMALVAYLSFRPAAEYSAGKSVAILPFRTDADAESARIAEGLFDQVHASLATVQNLAVISKTSSSLFQNSTQPLDTIASELKVTHVLVGSVKRRQSNLNVSLELVKVDENRTVWAGNFDGTLGQGVAFMNSVARQITTELNQKLSPEESRRMDRLPTRNVQAYNEYLRGVQLIKSRNNEKLLVSIRYFDRALALDPLFADALANKGLAYYLLGSDGHMELLKSLRLAEQNALAAISIDEENGLAYATLANGYWRLNKLEQALTTYQIALRHRPNDALIHYWYSLALRTLGRFDEAIRYGNRALILDPLYPTIVAGHVGNYSYAGRFAEAWQLIKDSEPVMDGFYMYYYVRAFYFLNQEDHPQALREFMKSDSLNPGYKLVTMFSLYCRARLGERAPAEAQVRALTDVPDHYVYKAILYAGLKDRERCLHYLELGAPLGIVPEYLKISPLYSFLRDEPRFQAVLRQLGLL